MKFMFSAVYRVTQKDSYARPYTSMRAAVVARQISKRYSSCCHVFISMWGVIRSTASMICCLKSARSRTFLLYTTSLIKPHAQKSNGVKSGDLGGQAVGPSACSITLYVCVCVSAIDIPSNMPGRARSMDTRLSKNTSSPYFLSYYSHYKQHGGASLYLHTACSRVLLEKLTGSQLVKKFPHFVEPEGSLPHSQVPATSPYPEPDQNPVHAPRYKSWRSILILSSHLCLGLPSCLFSSGFPTLNLYTPLLSPIRAKWPAHLILLHLITRIVFDEQYRSLSSSLCSFSPLPCHLVHLGPKYSPQHPILKHPHPTLLPQCERPSFTPIQNKR